MKYLFLGACAFAFLGGLVTGKSAFGHTWHEPEEEIACIAQNIYWEARNQPAKGMIGVALVTRNRVMDVRFPHSYCEVIEQGPTRKSWRDPNMEYPIRHRCQFSWYCDGKSDDIPNHDRDVYQFALSIAYKIYFGELRDFTNGATHYHATYVSPDWKESKTKTLRIADHIFYRWEMP